MTNFHFSWPSAYVQVLGLYICKCIYSLQRYVYYLHYGNLQNEEGCENIFRVTVVLAISLTVSTKSLDSSMSRAFCPALMPHRKPLLFAPKQEPVSFIVVQMMRGCECSGTVLAPGRTHWVLSTNIASLFKCTYILETYWCHLWMLLGRIIYLLVYPGQMFRLSSMGHWTS